MELEIYQVDAFTCQAFTGNPAAVCITEKGLDEHLMLQIADEMAVSETAFLSLEDWRLRWFTPNVEVALCGHGTLAVAHVLTKKGLARVGDVLAFKTLSGTLNAHINETNIALNFPAAHLNPQPCPELEWLELFGLSQHDVVACYEFDTKQLLVVEDEDIVRQLTPQFERLKTHSGRGVVISAASQSPNYDFISRYFAPWVGVNEDPVTGSAHCALAEYWGPKLNKTVLKGYQASSRGGEMGVERLPNQRVKLSGTAVTMLHGKMILFPGDA